MNRKLNFHLFDGPNDPALNTNTTGSQGLSAEMKTFYDKVLIKCAEPSLVHDQFGQKRPIPKNTGKTIEFRKFSSLPKALTPLTEGVTPAGQSYEVSSITATISQYGAYVTLADMLLLTAFDNNMAEITRMLGSQAGRTSDTITRDIIQAGTNVIYANGAASKSALDSADRLTVTDLRRGVLRLKSANASKIDGSWVALIHPDAEFDIMSDPDWKSASEYAGSKQIFKGEIGQIYGVRFVESTEAKVFYGADLASDSRNLTLNGAITAGAQTGFSFDGGTVAVNALKGRKITIAGITVEVTSNTATAVTFASTVFPVVADNTVIYPGEGCGDGTACYGTIILGADAFGITSINNGGIETIAKQLGSGGTSDPLNQRATVGWKLNKTACILSNEFMVRIEHGATYGQNAAN